MLTIATLILALAPQGVIRGRDDRLVIPQDRPGATRTAPLASDADLERRFHEAVRELRRSRHLPASTEAAMVRQLGVDFDRVAERAIALLQTADADVAYGAARALAMHSVPPASLEVARQLEFLLLTRKFGSATDEMVRTMARLAGPEARDRLFQVFDSANAVTRRHAADELALHVGADDEQQLLLMSRQARDDVRIKSLRLLGALPPSERVRGRLLAALDESPMLADAAVEALIAQGAGPAADLQAILRQPAVGRNFGYAALALVGIEEASGRRLLTEDMREPLIAELDMPDPFQRSAVALALGDMAWRSEDVDGSVWRDHLVVGALVDVVAPVRFIDHLATLDRFARRRLVTLTGQDFGGDQRRWREWWEQMRAAPSYVGARLRVPIDEAGAAGAVLAWSTPTATVVLRGPDSPAPLAGDDAVPVLDHILAPERFTELVRDLERLGFMRETREPAGAPADRKLTLQLGTALARTDVAAAPEFLGRLGARLATAAETESWQLYRNPETEPDAAAYWRSEQRWLERHPDPAERATRVIDRILAVLPGLTGLRRGLALQHLAAVPDLAAHLDEADGLALAAAAGSSAEWDEIAVRILELALLAPGDRVWRELVQVAEARDAQRPPGVAVGALERIFALIGPDRLLACASEGSPLVRRAAIDEIAKIRDLRATPMLIATAVGADQPAMIRRTAIYALGQLGAVDAREPLLALCRDADPSVSMALKRTAWVALARIGGDGVLAVLRDAFPSPDPDDRAAVIQALGEMRDPRAARELVGILVLRGEDTFGQLAAEQLRRQGDLIASPSLIEELANPSQKVRRQVAVLLGDFQRPEAIDELIAMLAEDVDRIPVSVALSSITGVDLVAAEDRVPTIRGWKLGNETAGQPVWFLRGLAAAGVATTLRPEDFGASAGLAAVPELCRLALEAEAPHLRALAGRLLRAVTQEDFGTITPVSDEAQRTAIVDRYLFLYESRQAAVRDR